MLLEPTSTVHWALGFLEWPGDVSQWPTRELRLYLEKRKIRHQAGKPYLILQRTAKRHSWKRGPDLLIFCRTASKRLSWWIEWRMPWRKESRKAQHLHLQPHQPHPLGAPQEHRHRTVLALGFGKGQYLGWLAVSERSPRGASYTLGSWWRFQAFEQKRVSWNSGVFPYMLMPSIWQPEDISDAKNM